MFLHEKFMGVKPGEYSERDDVINNLNNIFMTKRGVGSFLRNFGLTETGHKTQAEMITSLTREIKENILLYEPRVELVEVDEDFDDETNRTVLSVHLKIRSDGQPLHFSMDSKLKQLQLAPDTVADEDLD